jgi:hypothetical protein
MKPARGLTVALVGMLSAAALPSPALAYQEAGHYYTVALLASRLIPQLSDPDAHVIAFCAQLPDQSADLDAVVVYQSAIKHSTFAWLSWAFSSSANSLEVRRMITVQQLLHGLTGGSATAVRNVAEKTLRTLRRQITSPESGDANRAASLCALGFAMHLYGDSYAHQIMGSPGEDDPDKVYSTGMGHARDLHYPDLPICAAYSTTPRFLKHCDTGDKGRFLRWHQGLAHAAEPLGADGAGGTIPADLESSVARQVLAHAADGTDQNYWSESQMESTLASLVGDAHPEEGFFARHPSNEPCEQVLQAALQAHLLPPTTAFHCKQAWDLFAAVALSHYASTPNSREHAPFDPATVYLNPLLQ